MKQVELKGVTYNVLGEADLDGIASEIQNVYKSMVQLRRPKGYKVFWALLRFDGKIELL